MAAIDKIYGTPQQWEAFRMWLEKHRPEYVDKYLYEKPVGYGPLCNLSKEADVWLWENCDLSFILTRIKEQYNGPPYGAEK